MSKYVYNKGYLAGICTIMYLKIKLCEIAVILKISLAKRNNILDQVNITKD